MTAAIPTPEELKAMRGRLDAATDGPWLYRPQVFDDWGTVRSGTADEPWLVALAAAGGDVDREAHRRANTDPYRHNGEFIAHARTDMPRLLDAIEALVAENSELVEANERAQKLLTADLSLLRMGPSELGFTLETAGRAISVLAGSLARWLEEHHAQNYTETAFEQLELSGGFKTYIVTVQRAEGITPHQARMKAEKDLAEALSTIASLQDQLSERNTSPTPDDWYTAYRRRIEGKE